MIISITIKLDNCNKILLLMDSENQHITSTCPTESTPWRGLPSTLNTTFSHGSSHRHWSLVSRWLEGISDVIYLTETNMLCILIMFPHFHLAKQQLTSWRWPQWLLRFTGSCCQTCHSEASSAMTRWPWPWSMTLYPYSQFLDSLGGSILFRPSTPVWFLRCFLLFNLSNFSVFHHFLTSLANRFMALLYLLTSVEDFAAFSFSGSFSSIHRDLDLWTIRCVRFSVRSSSRTRLQSCECTFLHWKRKMSSQHNRQRQTKWYDIIKSTFELYMCSILLQQTDLFH